MDDDLDLRDFQGVGRLFPLPGVVLFPHVVMPLHVFELRYQHMMEDALASDRLVTLVQVRSGQREAVGVAPALEAVGCLGRILNEERFPDGRFNLLLLGRKRVRLHRELASGTLYRQAELEILEDVPESSCGELIQGSLQGQFRALMAARGALDQELDALLKTALPLGVLTDILAHTLDLPASLKQRLLVERRPGKRAERLSAVLSLLRGEGRAGGCPPPFSVN